MKYSKIKGLRIFSLLFSLCAIPSTIYASDFSLPFINAAGAGDLYADWATSAEDASTAYANPAGLTNLSNKQIVFAAVDIYGRSQFKGTTTPPFLPNPPQSGAASTKMQAFLPSFYYAQPISDTMVFGFGETVPFGLGTSYTKDSIVRYAGTTTQISVIDIGPSLGFKLSDKLSAGIGLDAQRMSFTINGMYGFPLSTPDSEGQNHLSGWGYGWHGGLLYQLIPTTRVGLSHHSMVMFHTKGDSQMYGPAGAFRLDYQTSNAALPARTEFSIHHDLNSQLAVMGTVFYTNWRTLDKITMPNALIPGGTTTCIVIPLNYHNTFDYSLGLHLKASEKWLLRTGVEFWNTPTNDQNRSITDPIGSATILGLGAHYQHNREIGFDVGYEHGFFNRTDINFANALTTATGTSTSSTNVLGAQVTWNII